MKISRVFRKRMMLLSMVIFTSGPGWASDSAILTINGNVQAAPCEVAADSLAQTVDLGKGKPINSYNLREPGAATPWIYFSVNLTKCPPNTRTAKITFNGPADPAGVGDLYRNGGTAKNVAVQLQGSGGHPFGDGRSYTGLISNNAIRYNLRARLYSKQGNVGVGSVNTLVTVTFTYQ